MQKKIAKLALLAGILATSLTVGAPTRTASAAGWCQDQCCDAWCTSVRHCFRAGGSCICEEFCTIGIDPIE